MSLREPPVRRDPARRRPGRAAVDEVTEPERGRRLRSLVLPAAVVAVLCIAVALRFATTSALWLDEALSVNIARLPVSELFEALRHDGHPPFYYLLLHGWMALLGTGDVAVRTLSGIFSTAAIGVIWVIGKRLGGRRVAWTAALLLATSPFGLRYATETRMYALVVLLTLLGTLAVLVSLDRPSAWRLGGVAACSGVLSLTHYWGLFLIATTGGLLLVHAWRGTHRGPALRTVVALAGGTLLFVPWVPSFLFQLMHTGTPWALPGTWSAVAAAISAFAGGVNNFGVGLMIVFVALTGFALFGVPTNEPRTVMLDLNTRPLGRDLAAVVFGTLTLAIAVGLLTGSAYTSRYASVVLGPYLLLVALGIRVVGDSRLRSTVTALAVVFGLLGSVHHVFDQRTQAIQAAEVIAERGEPGDLVVYCPDQLGPAHDRLLGEDFRGMSFPTGDQPDRVDWVDYEERQKTANAYAFAEEAVARAGNATIWLVSAPGYLTFARYCDGLGNSLQQLRTVERRHTTINFAYYERSMVTEYPASIRPPFTAGVVE